MVAIVLIRVVGFIGGLAIPQRRPLPTPYFALYIPYMTKTEMRFAMSVIRTIDVGVPTSRSQSAKTTRDHMGSHGSEPAAKREDSVKTLFGECENG
jgi:hypothetical protein